MKASYSSNLLVLLVATFSVAQIADAKFDMPKPSLCFSEWYDKATQQAIVRFEDSDDFAYERVSDLDRATQAHQWDQASRLNGLNSFKFQTTQDYDQDQEDSWQQSGFISSLQMDNLSVLGRSDSEMRVQVFNFAGTFDSTDRPRSMQVKYSQDGTKIVNIGFSTQRDSSVKFLRKNAAAQTSSQYDYTVTIGENMRIVGFTAKLRTDKVAFVDTLSAGGLSQMQQKQRIIVALGLVVFDEGNPVCQRHPTTTEQYQYEWTFANLDKNADALLSPQELETLFEAAPELNDVVTPKVQSDLSLTDFVSLIWYKRDSSGQSSLKKVQQYFSNKQSDDSDTEDDLLSDISDQVINGPNSRVQIDSNSSTGLVLDITEWSNNEDQTNDDKPFDESRDEDKSYPEIVEDIDEQIVVKDAFDQQLITELRNDLADNSAALQESKDTNLIIMVVVGFLIALIVVAILIASVYMCVIRKKPQSNAAESGRVEQGKEKDFDDPNVNIVDPGFESPAPSQCDNNSMRRSHVYQQQLKPHNSDDMEGLPGVHDSPRQKVRTSQDLMDQYCQSEQIGPNQASSRQEGNMRQTCVSSSQNSNFLNVIKASPQVRTFQEQHHNNHQEGSASVRVHTERDENEADQEQMSDDTAQRPMALDYNQSAVNAHYRRGSDGLNGRRNQHNETVTSQLDLALITPIHAGTSRDESYQFKAGVPQMMSQSMDNASFVGRLGAQRVKDMTARTEKLVQELLLRNQQVIIDRADIMSQDQYENESQLSDF